MATRTQPHLEVEPQCVHEFLCRGDYDRHRTRLRKLCRWMAADAPQARQLELSVFLESWREAAALPGADDNVPALRRDDLARSFAGRFQGLFRSEIQPEQPRPAGRPRLVGGPRSVDGALGDLPQAHRLLYLMHELEGYSAATLANWLGLDCRHCAGLIHQARLWMRQSLLAA